MGRDAIDVMYARPTQARAQRMHSRVAARSAASFGARRKRRTTDECIAFQVHRCACSTAQSLRARAPSHLENTSINERARAIASRNRACARLTADRSSLAHSQVRELPSRPRGLEARTRASPATARTPSALRTRVGSRRARSSPTRGAATSTLRAADEPLRSFVAARWRALRPRCQARARVSASGLFSSLASEEKRRTGGSRARREAWRPAPRAARRDSLGQRVDAVRRTGALSVRGSASHVGVRPPRSIPTTHRAHRAHGAIVPPPRARTARGRSASAAEREHAHAAAASPVATEGAAMCRFARRRPRKRSARFCNERGAPVEWA
jgi:hypothetical protein